MIKYKVSEIFQSIDGEGIRAGQPVNFVRLAGCNLRCSYCDTLYALFGEKEPCVYETMTAREILMRLNPLFKRITLTGGEPLIADGVARLTELFCINGYEVNIETNGAADICEFMSALPDRDNLFFTIDYKLPSSGMEEKMILNNFLNLCERDAIKFVVGTDEDFERMISVAAKLKEHYADMPKIYIGAVFEKYNIRELTERVLAEPDLCDAKVQLQLHKFIWKPDERGV